MPLNYSQDDMEDYANENDSDEQFNEDNLNDEDYNTLYELLPKVKEQTDGKYRNLDDQKIKELLWMNYFSIDDTIEEIKRSYKSKYTLFLLKVITWWWENHENYRELANMALQKVEIAV